MSRHPLAPVAVRLCDRCQSPAPRLAVVGSGDNVQRLCVECLDLAHEVRREPKVLPLHQAPGATG